MNNKITAALFLFLLPMASQAGEVKAMIGPNWSKYLFSGEIDSLNRQQKTGFGIGLGWAMALNRKMKLEVDALLGGKGAKTFLDIPQGKTIPGTYKNTSIAFPFLFKYQLKDKATPYAALGPEFVFILSHRLHFPDGGNSVDILDNTRKFVIGFNVLLGYEYPVGQWSLFAEIRYNRWLSNFLTGAEATVKSESVAVMLGGVYHL